LIKISAEELEQGLKMAGEASCTRSFHCLWGERKYLPRENCCGVVDFRDIFEHSSGLLFNRFLELSGYNRITYDFMLLEIGMGAEKLRDIRRTQEEIRDLHIFTQGFLLIFYPLFLANNEEIPCFSPDQLKEEEKKLFQKSFYQTAVKTERKMFHINRYWLGWVRTNYLESFTRPKKYAKLMFFLVNLFLAYIQRNKIPDILGFSAQEKERFFQEIKKEIL